MEKLKREILKANKHDRSELLIEYRKLIELEGDQTIRNEMEYFYEFNMPEKKIEIIDPNIKRDYIEAYGLIYDSARLYPLIVDTTNDMDIRLIAGYKYKKLVNDAINLMQQHTSIWMTYKIKYLQSTLNNLVKVENFLFENKN